MDTELKVIKVRQGTAARLAAFTPGMGEPCWTTDTHKLYIGDGATVGGVPVFLPTPVEIIIACSDETTALVAGAAKVTFRAPAAFTLTAVYASVTTAPTGALLTIDVNNGGVSVFSTKVTIDATEKTSKTAATPAVISGPAIADDAEITIDIVTVGSTIAGAGLKVVLVGYK